MELIIAAFFVLGVFPFILKLNQPTRVITRKPKYKQYNGNRNSNYFMKRISEAYHREEEPTEECEEDNDYDDTEIERDMDFSPIWSNQQVQNDSYKIEDVETRSKFFIDASIVLDVIAILCMLGINIIEKIIQT